MVRKLGIFEGRKSIGSVGYYTLLSDSTTSSGVYKDGVKVRDLWNNEFKLAGTYSKPTWDGNDNSGNPVTLPADIRVLSSQISWTWEGSIGNSTNEEYGYNKTRALRTPYDMIEVGSYLYLCTGFVEGNTSTIKILKSDLGRMEPVRASQFGDIDAEIRFVATDGTRIYWGGLDPYASQGSNVYSMVYATYVSDDTDWIFSSGVTTTLTYAFITYSSIRPYTPAANDTDAIITGMDVSSSYLYTTHTGKGQVKCFNKTTGALVRTITMSLSNICIDGSFLYGIDGSDIDKYTIETDGTLTFISTIATYTTPIDISIKSGTLLIVDKSTHQVHKYISDTFDSTIGTSGGYLNSPYASNTKFHFIDFNNVLLNKGFTCQQSDGSFWIGDSGNLRTLHFTSSNVYIEKFNYVPMNYNVAVCQNEPDRVFAGFVEFSATTGEFVANWEGNLTTNYKFADRRNIFYNLLTIDGSTFGTIMYYPSLPTDDGRQAEWVKLTATGLTYSGYRYDPFESAVVESNGDVISFEGTVATSGTQPLTKRPYTGLTAGFMSWSAPVTITQVPLGADKPSYSTSTRVSSKGYFFQPQWEFGYRHLGRVVDGEWVWLSSPSTAQSYTGSYPTDGTFDCGNSIPIFGGYAGWETYSIDNLVVWNYIGEGWKNDQVNHWTLFHEDGLMLQLIGIDGETARLTDGKDAPRKMAGNALSGQIVSVGSDYHIYYCDESHQGAISRFVISNVNTISTHTFTEL